MGFYGNITNTTRTQFSFDAVYNSRYEMDTSGPSDHVYVGRYVLIEYDTANGSLDKYPACYKVVDDDLVQSFVFCISPEFIVPESEDDNGTVIQLGEKIGEGENAITVEKGTIIRIPGSTDEDGNLYNQYTNNGNSVATEYWICTGESTGTVRVPKIAENGKVTYETSVFKTATWEVVGTSSSTNFMLNYNQDKIYYGVSRGYDSTVWQKVLQNGYEKYVMVAELNTVVPTFDLAADAPTQIPLIPHFDVNSTNVYYKLHWQPNWGFRVRSASTLQTPQLSTDGEITSSTISTSNDAMQYPSDENMVWQRSYYDKTSNNNIITYAKASNKQITWVDKSSIKNKPELPAAIYYNKDGLSPEKVVKSWDKTYENQSEYNSAPRRNQEVDPSVDLNGKNFVSDEIAIKPSGLSGQMYQTHSGNESSSADVQELSIMLPSIGDAISDVWDLVYGGRATNEVIQKTQKRNMDVEWYDARAVQDRAGLRLVKDGFTTLDDSGDKITCEQNYYNKANVNTVAGCINSVHDLMGMIIQPYETADQIAADDINNTTDIILYSKDDKKYYRKGNRYEYTPITDYKYEAISLSKGEYRRDLYYVLKNGKYIVATGDYDENATYYVRKLSTPAGFSEVTLTDFDGSYYYKNQVNSTGKFDYIRESEYHRDKTYYKANNTAIDKTREDLGDEFTIGKYYLQSKTDGVATYTLDKNSYQDSVAYYEIEEIFSLDKVDDAEVKYTDLYLPGIFYYKAWNKDVYESIIYDGSQTGTFYTLNDDGTYSEYKGPLTQNDTYYVKFHSEGDPYLETKDINKNDFEYLVDNTPQGTGNESNKNLLDHYMVEAKDSQVEIYTPVDFYVPISFDDNSGYTYAVDTYYVYNRSTNEYVKSSDASPQEGTQYYELQTKYIFSTAGGTINENNALHLLPYNATSIKYIDNKGEQQTFKVDSAHPWFLKEVQTSYDEDGNESKKIIYTEVTPSSMREKLINFYIKKNTGSKLEYFKINRTKISSFYLPNRYYYKVGAKKDSKYQGSYILETNKNRIIENSSDDSYALAHLTIDDKLFTKVDSSKIRFYFPNYFYYTLPGDEGNYILGTEDKMVTGATYYTDAQYYVSEDTSGTLPYGQLWNGNIKNVPPSVTLAKRTLTYDYYELKDFARKLNTIHGMILKMNQLIDEENTGSRELTTVQGVLNNLNDWISKLGTMDSQEIVMVDNYGRMQTAAVDTTSQVTGSTITKTDSTDIKSDIFPKVSSCADKGWKNQWLTINIDGKPTNPKITLRHNYQPVSDTTSTHNVNKNGDTIVTKTPIIDPMGHVVGTDSKTITLPYGFKTIKTNGRVTNNNTSELGTQKDIIADNTQDVLTINSGDEWIKITTDESSDKMTISHDIKKTTSTTSAQSLISESKTMTFEVPTYTFDTTNHFSGKDIKTFTLPNNYGKIAADNGTTTEASASHDTFTLSGDSWIKTTVSQDKVTFTHETPEKTGTTTYSTNGAPALGEKFSVPTVSYDKNGHIYNNGFYTIELPSLELSGSKTSGDNVLVDLTYEKNGTKFNKTYGKIGDLALTGYATPEAANGEVVATDSLNSAIGKLQYSINQELADRKEAITDLRTSLKFEDSAVDNQYVSAVNEVDGVISVEREDFPQADTEKFGITKLFDDYDDSDLFFGENPIDLTGLAASATALRRLYLNSYNETNYFEYDVATKILNDNGEVDISTTPKMVTLRDVIRRVEALEALIVKESTSIEVNQGLSLKKDLETIE